MGKNDVYPDKTIMITADEHDRNQLEILVDYKKAMYVFDRGYVDYEYWMVLGKLEKLHI